MIPGSLIRFKSWPHEELFESGMTGLILETGISVDDYFSMAIKDPSVICVLVLWDRSHQPDDKINDLKDCISLEYIEEVELVPSGG